MEDTRDKVRRVAVAVADLIFAARIRAAADSTGVHARFARSETELREAAAEADLVILDLDARWLDAPAAIAGLKEQRATPIVAFVSHVRADAIEAARDAGADRVLARSAFVNLLPEILMSVI